MGYSCTVRASKTYDAIQTLDEFDRKGESYSLFTEIGRENKDGSITGKIYGHYLGDFQLDDCGNKVRPCKFLGRFKIDSLGRVIRFPGLSRRFWRLCEIASIEAYDREYPMYSLESLMI